jgi:hypothetical protein
MSRLAVHQSKVVQRRQHTITGTSCNRMSNAGDDLNVADSDVEVTCKFCLRIMRRVEAKLAFRSAS